MFKRHLAFLPLVLLCGSALAQAPKPVATTLQIMKGMILPAADRIFAAGNEGSTDASAWIQVEYDALNIAEAANLLI